MSSLDCSIGINGVKRVVKVDADETLLTTLRERLFLLGAKRGCNQGVCGACTVQVDGIPVRACLSLSANCDGKEIRTVEGFEHDDLGARLQAAFVEVGAVQCGFCTAGALNTAYWLLSTIPKPSVEQIRDALSGNLCRCTGYRKIVEAIQSVAFKGNN